MDMEKRWVNLEKGFNKEELKSRGWKEISTLLDDLNLSENEQDFASENFECRCVDDAIRDFADSAVSVYTYDQIEYFEEHHESVDIAIAEGYVSEEEASITSADDIDNIQANLGAAAWYRDVFTELDCNDNVAVAVLYYKAQDLGRDMLSPSEIYNIETFCENDDFENGWYQAIESEFMDEDNLSVEALSYDELNELAGKMIDNSNTAIGQGTSYDELLNAYDTVGYDAIVEKYNDVSFCLDDFWCDQEKDSSLETEAQDMSAAKDAQDDQEPGQSKDKDVR